MLCPSCLPCLAVRVRVRGPAAGIHDVRNLFHGLLVDWTSGRTDAHPGRLAGQASLAAATSRSWIAHRRYLGRCPVLPPLPRTGRQALPV